MVFVLLFFYISDAPEGSTESGFIEKLEVKPATPGLQDTGLSPTPRRLFPWFWVMDINCALDNQMYSG